MTRWRYGQKAHLESSLEALKLWDENDPPQLETIEEVEVNGRYALRLGFRPGAVAPARWQDRLERLGRFFGPGLEARLETPSSERLELSLIQP